MPGGPPKQPLFPTPVERKRAEKEALVSLALELSAQPEGFPFPGLTPAYYENLKGEETRVMGFATPIDTLVERMKTEGIKVVLGEDAPSGNVFILPMKNDDIISDSVLPRHLQINDAMDARLKELVLKTRKAILT